MKRILIADDHDLVRDTISAYIEHQEQCEIALAEDFDAAATKIAEEGPFDLVLLDYSMPGMGGLEGLGRAIASNGGNPVAIISGAADPATAQAALAAGASGFIPKTLSARSLLNAVRFMLAGEQFAPVDFMTQEVGSDKHPYEELLSERERQVLGGLCRGLSNKEVARELSLQEVTIKLHVKTLCRKLEARNRTHAAMIAKDAGFS